MARPRIEIDRREFEGLCGLLCTMSEIADWFGCSEDTIRRWCKRTYHRGFEAVFAEKSARGRMSLRRSQFELAKRSAAMAIFLGKNYLGQTDQQQVEITHADDESSAYIEDFVAGRLGS